MLVYTIGELLAIKKSVLPTTPMWRTIMEEYYHLYAFQDGESQIFYVGKSRNPLLRLHEHIRYSDAGYQIRKNRPDSLSWHMWLFSYRNCVPLVHDYIPRRYQEYLEALSIEELPKKSIPPLSTFAMEIAEAALIAHYWPRYNVANPLFIRRRLFTRPLARRDLS